MRRLSPTDVAFLLLDRMHDVGQLCDGSLVLPSRIESTLRSLPAIRNAVAMGEGRPFAACIVIIHTRAFFDGYPGKGGCGWMVEIVHANDVMTRYCHMVQKPFVTVGQEVTAGEICGAGGHDGGGRRD